MPALPSITLLGHGDYWGSENSVKSTSCVCACKSRTPARLAAIQIFPTGLAFRLLTHQDLHRIYEGHCYSDKYHQACRYRPTSARVIAPTQTMLLHLTPSLTSSSRVLQKPVSSLGCVWRRDRSGWTTMICGQRLLGWTPASFSQIRPSTDWFASFGRGLLTTGPPNTRFQIA